MENSENKSSKVTESKLKTPKEKQVSKAKFIQYLSKEVNRKATERMFEDLILGK